MDAISILKQDHRKVEELFAQFEKLGEKAFKSKAKVVAQVIQQLKVHTTLEETIFYPAFRPKAEEEMDVLEAYEEHHVAKFLMAELEALDPENERYDAKVIVLKELVKHHVEEEEKEMFPEARKALGKAELETLGQRIEADRPKVKQSPRVTVSLMHDTNVHERREV